MPPYRQTYQHHRTPGSHRGRRSLSVAATHTSQGMLPAGGGPVFAHASPYPHPSSHIGSSQVDTMPGPSNAGLHHWSGNSGPSFASTSTPTDSLPMWPAPPVGNTSQFPYNSGVNRVHTAPHVFPSPSRQGNVYPQPLAHPEHTHPQAVAQPRPLPISTYSTLSMALSMPAPQHQAAGQNHSSHDVGVTRNHSESVNNRINLGHGTMAAVLGTVTAAEGMNLVPNGLTETLESPHPTIRAQAAPTDHTADPSASAPNPTYSNSVTFHTPIVHAPTVPPSEGQTPPVRVRAIFPDERPPKARKLKQEFPREEASNAVLKDWNRINKALEAGMDVSFTGYIKSMDQYEDVSTKLLHCLETNCPSKCNFTRSSSLRDHMVRHHTTSVTLMDGETRTCPSYLARINEKATAKLGKAKYVELIKKYKSLKGMVNKADKP